MGTSGALLDGCPGLLGTWFGAFWGACDAWSLAVEPVSLPDFDLGFCEWRDDRVLAGNSCREAKRRCEPSWRPALAAGQVGLDNELIPNRCCATEPDADKIHKTVLRRGRDLQ